tara:strand:- start:297 stop:674 length:378 start_codon:yes stop_codon:yes gene_type:complete
MNINVLLGASLGLISILMGAYIEHNLRSKINEESLRAVMTSLRYATTYSLLILSFGLIAFADIPQQLSQYLVYIGALFFVGTALFSFSIFISVIASKPKLTIAAPFGGTALMAGWISLIWLALTY